MGCHSTADASDIAKLSTTPDYIVTWASLIVFGFGGFVYGVTLLASGSEQRGAIVILVAALLVVLCAGYMKILSREDKSNEALLSALERMECGSATEHAEPSTSHLEATDAITEAERTLNGKRA